MSRKKRRSMKDRVRRNSEEAPKRSGGGSVSLPEGVDYFKEDRRSKFDIIPYEVSIPNHPDGVEPGELWYKMPYKIHFGIGSENKAYVCPSSIHKKCPICEYRAQLMKKADSDEDTIAALKPKSRVLYNVISKAKDGDGEIQVWDVSYYNFQELLDEEILEGDEMNASFPDLEGGLTLKVRFSEEHLGKNKFFRASRVDFVERKDDYDESILDDVVKLDTALNILPYRELEKHFLEIDDEDESVEDEEVEEKEEEKPVRRERSRKSTRRRKEKEEKEDESAEEEEPEEEKPDRHGKDKKKGKDKKNKCPEGFEFGVDFDEHEECDDCDLWDDCMKGSDD